MLIPSANSKNIIPITASVLLLCSLGIGLSGCAADNTTETMTPAATGKPSSTSGEKKAIETNTPLPTPSGTLLAKLEFSCPNLEKILAIGGLSYDLSITPEQGTSGARALSSGGQYCRFQDSSANIWYDVSVEKFSAEDYRDIATSLGGFYSPAEFGSSNDSLEFFSIENTISTGIVLNLTYKITIQTNNQINENLMGIFANKTESLLISK